MAAEVVVIIAVADDSGASRIESNLEVIRQVTIRGLVPRTIESSFGDVGAVNHVVARFRPDGK